MGTFVADDPMTDPEGPIALVVADDDGLRAALCDVMRELGFGVALSAARAATSMATRARTSFAVALLCVGRGTPEEMRYLPALLSSPALAEATVIVATTASVRALPPLPVAGCAASVTLLLMPFEFKEIERLTRTPAAVAPKSRVIFSAAAAWDGAVDQVDRSALLEWTQWADLNTSLEFANCMDEKTAWAC